MSKQIFFHSKTSPRVTVCGILSENNVLKIGVARCSTKNAFVKKVGRDLAKKRAEGETLVKLSVLPKEQLSPQFISIAKGLAENVAKNPKLVHSSNNI